METTVTKQAREKSVNPVAISTTTISTPERHLPPTTAERHLRGPRPRFLRRRSINPSATGCLVRVAAPTIPLTCTFVRSASRRTVSRPPNRRRIRIPLASATSQLTTGAQIAGVQIAGAQITGVQIEDDRERFLKELKSQAFASHTQINATATFRCVLEHQHSGASEPAAVCHSCYGEARQQADRMEAALHMDTKEAAKIVYEAVWADTSDPNGTYLNAASALLSELRKRAGIGLLLGANQPLAH